jgi:hypothetical protein
MVSFGCLPPVSLYFLDSRRISESQVDGYQVKSGILSKLFLSHSFVCCLGVS